MLPIPYEAQEQLASCGAAALCMVYRSLGLECAQTEVWARVSRLRKGVLRGYTHLLGRDALSRGLDAVVVCARLPWEALTRCVANRVCVVLHHRLSEDDPSGHYSVLVGVEADVLTLHDPLLGPDRQIRREAFLRLWSPSRHSVEVVGHILVAIAPVRKAGICSFCEGQNPESVTCLACKFEIRLRPAEVIGCLADRCSGRLWTALYCPSCDRRL